MDTAANQQRGELASFHQAAWDRYSPTTPPPGRVPDATLDHAIAEFAGGAKALAHDILKSHPSTQSDANALNALGVMEMALEKFDDASATLVRAVALLEQRKAITLANLATLRIYQRNWAEAETFANLAIKAGPTVPHGWVNLLFVLARTDQHEELEALFNNMDAEFPDWRTCEEIVSSLKLDTLPALRKSPSVQKRIQSKLS